MGNSINLKGFIMENSNFSNKKIEDIFKAKEEYHQHLAKLPFEEKIKILVRLQEIAKGFHPFSNKKNVVWKITS